MVYPWLDEEKPSHSATLSPETFLIGVVLFHWIFVLYFFLYLLFPEASSYSVPYFENVAIVPCPSTLNLEINGGHTKEETNLGD